MSAGLRLSVFLFLVLLVAAMWVATWASKRFEHAIEGVVHFERQVFDTLTLVTVGSGGSFVNQHRRGPALLVGHGDTALLVDAGRGVSAALRAVEVPPDQPRHVLLTSLLPENLLGLDSLWLDAKLAGAAQPLRVYGPKGTAHFLETLKAAHRSGAAALATAFELEDPDAGELQAFELAGGERFRVGALEVQAALLAGGALPALAYRIEAPADADGSGGRTAGRALAIAVSGNAPERVAEFARGANLLVLEAVYGASLQLVEEAEIPLSHGLRREAAMHLWLEEAGALATRAEVGALVLTRLRPPPAFAFQYERLVRESFRGGPIFVAEDGDRFTPEP